MRIEKAQSKDLFARGTRLILPRWLRSLEEADIKITAGFSLPGHLIETDPRVRIGL